MKKDVAITLRIPAALKKRLLHLSKEAKRSLSSQVAHYIAAGIPTDKEREIEEAKPVRILGRMAGTKIPTEEDFREVRRILSAGRGPLKDRSNS